jgi:peptidyl-prolyl cis-trans isomerase SurA
MQEFKEGNLLFEIMQKQVWDKAAADTVGLKKYYQLHKNNYWWEPSADAVLFTCTNDSITQKTMEALEKNPSQWRALLNSEDGTLQADSSRFELSQIPVVERTAFRTGLITAPVKNALDGSSSFAYIIHHYPERAPRNFDDARGLVLNDYQLALEETWIQSLRKKYPVVIRQNVLNSLPK